MEFYRGDVHAQHAHVLYENGIHAGVVKPRYQPLGLGGLVVVYYGVYRYVDPYAEHMGVGAQLAYVADAVACRGARAEVVGTYVDGVGPVVYGRYATL